MSAVPQAVKDAAWARWQRLGWPTTRAEAWRNFSTRPFHDLELTGGIASGAAVPESVWARLPAPRVVFVDGRFAPEHTALGPLAERVVVQPLSAAPEPGRRPVHFDALVPEDGALEALNGALVSDGLALGVPAGVAAGVLYLVHLVTG
jgi:Fe-S cluster assembly protein SufD